MENQKSITPNVDVYTNVYGYRQTATSGRVILTKYVRLFWAQIVQNIQYTRKVNPPLIV